MKRVAPVLAFMLVMVMASSIMLPQLALAAPTAPRVYQGISPGFLGDITVHVVLEGDRLSAVHVVDHSDTPTLVNPLFDQMTRTMVENQSVNIDIVTGATLSSFGLIGAVRNALTASGQLDAFSTRVEREAVEHSDVEVDVVIIGGGGSGLMTALTVAHENFGSALTELDILVLERNGFLGGNTRTANGGIFVTEGAWANEYMDASSTPEQVYQFFLSHTEGEPLNFPLIRRLYSQSGETVEILNRFGVGVRQNVWSDRRTLPTGGGAAAIRPIGWRTFRDEDGNALFGMDTEGGAHIVTVLEGYVRNAGVDIRLNSRGTELIVENGEVVGVVVEADGTTYNVFAQKVVIATGGMTNNPAMIERLNPTVVGLVPFTIGSYGDGFLMGEAVNANIIGRGVQGYVGPDGRKGIYGVANALASHTLNTVFTARGNVHVNIDGEQFTCVNSFHHTRVFEHILAQPGHRGFAIFDAHSPSVVAVEYWLGRGYGYRANTIEELASITGIDAANLQATIAENNRAHAAGENGPFNRSNAIMAPIAAGPFYALEFRGVAIGTLMGLEVNEFTQVINIYGEIIPNLYAVGEMSFGGNILSRHYFGGNALQGAMGLGRIAGEHIKEVLLS